MILENKRKTQLKINRIVWADVNHYATLKGLSINTAAEHLLEKGLEDCGYDIAKDTAVSAGKSLATEDQQTLPWRDSQVTKHL